MQRRGIEPPTSASTFLRWYAFYSAIRAETRAGAAIEALGFPAFVPLERRRRKGRSNSYLAALFPRYGFVKFDIERAEWGSIVEANGVVDLLRVGNIPRAIPDSVIDSLQLADELGIFDRTKPPCAGVSVEITDGPCAGFIGRIIRARTDERVDVMLRMFGSEVSALVELASLREA